MQLKQEKKKRHTHTHVTYRSVRVINAIVVDVFFCRLIFVNFWTIYMYMYDYIELATKPCISV